MTAGSENRDGEYFLIPRDLDGDYIATAEQILRERGISEFTQEVRPGARLPADSEKVVLLELESLLPDRVHLLSASPFLALRVENPPDGAVVIAECKCECGGSQSCAGSGGGGAAAAVADKV